MELRKLFTDDRGVSPVVGVALLIAIAVILAAVIGAVVLGLGTGGADTPQAQLQGDVDTGSGTMELRHQGGEPLPADEIIVVTAGTEDGTLAAQSSLGTEESLTAGESVDVTITAEPVTLVWQDPNSDSETVLESFEE